MEQREQNWIFWSNNNQNASKLASCVVFQGCAFAAVHVCENIVFRLEKSKCTCTHMFLRTAAHSVSFSRHGREDVNLCMEAHTTHTHRQTRGALALILEFGHYIRWTNERTRKSQMRISKFIRFVSAQRKYLTVDDSRRGAARLPVAFAEIILDKQWRAVCTT